MNMITWRFEDAWADHLSDMDEEDHWPAWLFAWTFRRMHEEVPMQPRGRIGLHL